MIQSLLQIREFQLLDEENRVRAHLRTEGEYVVLSLKDHRGRDTLTLSVEGDEAYLSCHGDKGQGAFSLGYSPRNGAAISIYTPEGKFGFYCGVDVDGKPDMFLCDPSGQPIWRKP